MKAGFSNIAVNSIESGSVTTYKRLHAFLLLCVVVLLPISIVTFLGTHKYQTAIYFLVLLSLAIAGLFILNKRLILFEPIVLFSAYYITVVFAGIYSISTDFYANSFVNNTTFSTDIPTLIAYTCVYFFFGYVCMLLGYYLVKQNNLKIRFDLEPKSQLSDTVLNIFIITFLIIGIGNYIYNVWIYAGGNLFSYMANVSVRHIEFAVSGTTIGYIFAYNAMYIWFFKLARKNIYWSKFFIIILILTLLMKASTGRIFGTMLYIASFIGIYYYLEISSKRVLSNAKYYVAAIGIVLFGIINYYLRIISSLSYNNMLESGIAKAFIELFNEFGFYAVDKGNLPNIGVFLKIVDSWKNEIGYLYGQSLITWIFNILPSSIRPEAYQPSVMIKQTWYSHIPGGNLPPTGIGEMYANFGILGPFLGMFIFGCLVALLYNYTLKSKSYWFLAIYIQIAIGFIMLYPKGEFDNLTLWHVIPILLIVVTMKIISLSKHNGNRHVKEKE